MSIFCHTCRRSFPAGEKEILYDNGSNMAVFRCPTCGIKYLAIADDEHSPVPVLMKLTNTKSHVINTDPKPDSRIITQPESLIVTPAQAVAEARAEAARRRQ
jgi:DNA-directed RNA polymerase subunit RPC12/RpoP